MHCTLALTTVCVWGVHLRIKWDNYGSTRHSQWSQVATMNVVSDTSLDYGVLELTDLCC